ncbi:MAG TPA: GWxTD domain-containing protein [Thermoanaerobaculia bacterium]|nr:GWxTD domain-containing protein [Thermoanaerobaculia bacterium]
MKRIGTLLASIAIATAAFAQLSSKFIAWPDGPVKFLMTREEAQQWRSLRSDADARAFIELFWAKRDPTPDTPRNEFREEFERRVDFADRNFPGAAGRGALSDRGRALILLGPPYRLSASAGAQINGLGISVAGRGGASAATPRGPTADPDMQYWMYAHTNKPKFITQSDFTLVFARREQGEWQLATTERTNPEQVLEQAVNAYIVSPKLTRPPLYTLPPPPRSTSFKSADLKTAYEQFRAGDTDSVGSADLTWGEFVTSEGVHFISAQLYLPAGSDIAAGRRVTSFAVVEDPSGTILDVKEDDVPMAAAGKDAYIDRSVQLEPGTYNATFGIADGGRILAASRAIITVTGLDPAAAGTSPLLLATTIIPLKTNWQPLDPFTFGGFKVIPKGDSVFDVGGDLWYFLEMRNPGLTDSGKPNVRVQVDIEGNTEKGRVRSGLPMRDAPLAPLKDEWHRYALGFAIPLDGFRPGNYTIRVHVVDVVLGRDYEFEKAFRVRG